MKGIKRIMKSMTQDVSFFPSEFNNQPFITINGNGQITIENACTLQSYNTDKIVIASQDQVIEITGSGIKLKTMYKEELMIEGTFESIRFL